MLNVFAQKSTQKIIKYTSEVFDWSARTMCSAPEYPISLPVVCEWCFDKATQEISSDVSEVVDLIALEILSAP